MIKSYRHCAVAVGTR